MVERVDEVVGADVTPVRERRGGGDRRAGDGRRIRIAAVGDFHCGEEDAGAYRELFARANEDADVLVLTGDLTRRGFEAEMRVVVGELVDVKIPIIAVLGNHDHEAGQTRGDGASTAVDPCARRGPSLRSGGRYGAGRTGDDLSLSGN